MLLICRQWTRHANIATLYKQFCFPIVFAEGHILTILIVIYNQKLTTWHFWITNLYFAIVCLAWGYHTAAACRVCRHNENNTLYPLCRACLGQCFSYSVPNTFPQSTESLVHCDSCMPAQTQWEVVSCILAHVTGTHQHRLVKLTRKPQVSEMKDGNHCWTRSRSFKKKTKTGGFWTDICHNFCGSLWTLSLYFIFLWSSLSRLARRNPVLRQQRLCSEVYIVWNAAR